jgi:hypothetical protein
VQCWTPGLRPVLLEQFGNGLLETAEKYSGQLLKTEIGVEG